jgi:metal-responsive CopG/Arc/MetJ family transcriptional regulator
MSPKTTTKITLNFPQGLLELVDGTAAQLEITRSALIRTAVAEYTKKLREEKLKRELIEGYKANAELLRQTSEDFKYVDGENI